MREKIINQFKKKIQDLKHHNKKYYINDNPEISDLEYDKLKLEIIDLENRYPFLNEIDSITKIVGSPPSNKFKKIRHLKPMLSLSNAFDKENMQDFIKKILNFLN